MYLVHSMRVHRTICVNLLASLVAVRILSTTKMLYSQ